MFLIDQGNTSHALTDTQYQAYKNNCQRHPHTYWLKYLMLHYIGNSRELINKIDLINTFSKVENGCAYNEGIVRLLLQSLLEVDHGRLIRPSTMPQNNAKLLDVGLELTERGKPFIDRDYSDNDKPVQWTLCYLTHIITDSWLEFPKVKGCDILDELPKIGSCQFLYSIDEEDYEKGMNNYLLERFPLVIKFLTILEVSYEYEKKLYPEIFKKLHNQGFKKPNFNLIKKDLIIEYKDICNSLSNGVTKNNNQKSNLLYNIHFWFEIELLKLKLRRMYGKSIK